MNACGLPFDFSLRVSFCLFLQISLSALLMLLCTGCQILLTGTVETEANKSAITTIKTLNPEQQKAIEDFMRGAVEAVNFNGTLLLANSQSVLFQQSYGYVDASQSGAAGIPLTPEYAFSPGSVAKEFSTVALMHLKQAQKIDFGTPLSAYVHDLPGWADKVTVEHLLTHTSGIPDVRYKRKMTTEQAIQDIKAIEQLEFAPGSGFLYSNNNTILRSLVVEHLTGISFEDYLHQHIFPHFGMTRTQAKSNFSPANGKVAKGAIPLALKGVTAFTTAHELYLWQKGLWSGKLVSQAAMRDAITTPGLGSAGRARYDFGFYRQNPSGDITLLEHDGTYPIHYTWSLYDLEHDLYVILLSNDGRKASLNEIKRVLHKYLTAGKIVLNEKKNIHEKVNPAKHLEAYQRHSRTRCYRGD